MALDDLINTINSGEDRERPERDEFVVDGMSVPAASAQATDTSRFEQKITIGPYDKDSDDLMSMWGLSSFVGGALVDNHTEGGTDQRFRWSSLWTLHPGQLALPPEMHTYVNGPVLDPLVDIDAVGQISMPLIECAGLVYLAFGKQLYSYAADPYTPTGEVFQSVMTLAGYAQGTAVFAPDDTIMMIPLGANGVDEIRTHTHGTPHTRSTTHATVTAIQMVSWDKKVWAVTTDGYLRVWHPATGWDPASVDLQVPSDQNMRGIEVFWDRSGNQTIFVMTDKQLWVYDPDTVTLIPGIGIPRHHTTGIGFAQWRDDALYISSGLGIDRYSRDGVRTFVGLDRDEGIPSERMGDQWGTYFGSASNWEPSHAISSLTGSRNFLIATLALGNWTTVPGQNGGMGGVALYNEAGWHPIWLGASYQDDTHVAVRYPRGVLVTEQVGGYRVWFGWGAGFEGTSSNGAWVGRPQVMAFNLERNAHAPRKQLSFGTSTFAEQGTLETGWFDAGMSGFEKAWSHIEVEIPDPGDGTVFDGEISIYYQIDDDTTWSQAGGVAVAITDYGHHVIPFGLDADGFPRGLSGTKIRFMIEMITYNPAWTPVVEYMLLKFIKLPLPGRAWIFNVPLDAENPRGMGPQEISDALSKKTYAGTFSRLKHQGRDVRVRFAQHQVVEGVGDVPYKQATVNVIEVPIPGYPPWDGGPENE